MSIPGESSSGKPQPMGEFFDERAGGYEEHMRGLAPDMVEFYRMVSAPVAPTDEEIAVLDLGIGTGLELEGLFARAPRARVDGIDLSSAMLKELRGKYPGHLDRIELRLGSFLAIPFPQGAYDYVVSVMALHHLARPPKKSLYARIRAALKPGGLYIEGDYMVGPEEERAMLGEYEKSRAAHGLAADGLYHIDLPFSLGTQMELLREAGFKMVEAVWEGTRKAILAAGAGG